MITLICSDFLNGNMLNERSSTSNSSLDISVRKFVSVHPHQEMKLKNHSHFAQSHNAHLELSINLQKRLLKTVRSYMNLLTNQ